MVFEMVCCKFAFTMKKSYITKNNFEVVEDVKHWYVSLTSVKPLSIQQRTAHENKIMQLSLERNVEYSGWKTE